MLFARLSLVALASALVGTASGLSITSPGGPNLWWVDDSENTLVWDCSDKTYDQFNILIANSNPSVLTAPLPIIPTVPNYVCSKLITATQLNVPAATGYTIQLTNIFNNTDVYATSQPFEVKALGAAYPASSATPNGSNSGSPSSTATGSSPSSSSSSNSNSSNKSGGSKNVWNALGAFAAIVVGVVTA